MLGMHRPFAVLRHQHSRKSGAGAALPRRKRVVYVSTARWQVCRRGGPNAPVQLGMELQVRCLLGMHRPFAVLRGNTQSS